MNGGSKGYFSRSIRGTAVPARRYADLGGTLEGLRFEDGLVEGRFAEQSAKWRARIAELEMFAEKLAGKLDAQDEGLTERGRRATDRGAYSRFQRAVVDAELTRFVQADYRAERFSYSVDEAAIERAKRFDGRLVLLTSIDDFPAAEIVTRYKNLADIERGFRVLTRDLEIALV
jgi:hypothetical protein